MSGDRRTCSKLDRNAPAKRQRTTRHGNVGREVASTRPTTTRWCAPRGASAAAVLAVLSGCATEFESRAPSAAATSSLTASCDGLSYWTPGAYSGGERVRTGDSAFQCKSWPASGWCGLDAYQPGVGFAWQDAWDHLGACDAGGGSFAHVYQAEMGTLSNAAYVWTYANWTGGGYVDLSDGDDSSIEWTVHALTSASAALELRFANAGPPATLQVHVNGTAVATDLTLANTGGWTSWQTTSALSAELVPGDNVVRLSATGGHGGPNIDMLRVRYPVTTPPWDGVLRWPVAGAAGDDWVIHSYYDDDESGTDYLGGPRTYPGHDGTDLFIPSFREMDNDRAEVLAIAAGIVREVLDTEGDRNNEPVKPVDRVPPNYVQVVHDNGVIAEYVHLKRGAARVSVGQRVSAGDVLGIVGASGNGGHPHLHLRLHYADDYDESRQAVYSPTFDPAVEGPFVDAGAWPAYDAPAAVMDVMTLVSTDPNRPLVKDPGDNVTQMNAGETLAVGLSLAGGVRHDVTDPTSGVADVANVALIRPDGSPHGAARQASFTGRHADVRGLFFAIGAGDPAGTWAIEVDINGSTIVRREEFEVVGAAASCSDGVKNGSESDVDCGGECDGCGIGQICGVDADCQSNVCADGVCGSSSDHCSAPGWTPTSYVAGQIVVATCQASIAGTPCFGAVGTAFAWSCDSPSWCSVLEPGGASSGWWAAWSAVEQCD